MAKKVRGSRASHRPGGQGPSRTKKSTSGEASTSATDDVVSTGAVVDIDGAVDAVAMQSSELAIEERAPAVAKPRRSRRGAKTKADSLEARSIAEDVYVREDLRRIGIISVVLVVGLIGAWALLVPMNLAGLY